MLDKTLIVIKIHKIHKWQIQEQIKTSKKHGAGWMDGWMDGWVDGHPPS